MTRAMLIAAAAATLGCAPTPSASEPARGPNTATSTDSAPSNQQAPPPGLDESVLCSCTACLPREACESRFSPRSEGEGSCYEERYRVPASTGCEAARSDRCCE